MVSLSASKLAVFSLFLHAPQRLNNRIALSFVVHFFLVAVFNLAEIHVAHIIGAGDALQLHIAVFRVCTGEIQKLFADHFQRPQVVGGEDQLAYAVLGENLQHLAPDVLKDACVEFVDGKGEGRIIICSGQKAQHGNQTTDPVRFVPQGQF